MVKIRLRRTGAKKRPTYRVVAADSRAPRDGRFIETLGHYNPLADPVVIEINEEKALKWLRNGAQATETAERLMRSVGIWEQFRPGDEPRHVKNKRTKRKSKAEMAAEAAAKPAESETKSSGDGAASPAKAQVDSAKEKKPVAAEEAAGDKPAAEKPATEEKAAKESSK